jgi:D-alanine-D-alanine ligase
VIAERFVKGRELTVGILGCQALPIVEIRTSRGFFDFEAKYQKGMTEYLVPADLPAKTAGQIGSLALAAFQAVGCRDFARVDFLLAEDGNPVILEINTIPGFTETSLLPMAAACAGYDFSGLCVQLMRSALERVQQ